jgi:hypothetical protein
VIDIGESELRGVGNPSTASNRRRGIAGASARAIAEGAIT